MILSIVSYKIYSVYFQSCLLTLLLQMKDKIGCSLTGSKSDFSDHVSNKDSLHTYNS